MPSLRNLLGQQFGYLTVLETAPKKSRRSRTRWVCSCACRRKTVVAGCHLVSRHTRSCGCLRRATAGARVFKDCVGQQFGRLVVLRKAGTDKHHKMMWVCVCDCGNIIVVSRNKLARGKTKSCGCLRRETARELNRTHGLSKTRAYKSYKAAKRRCTDPKSKDFADYGGRGIEFRYNSIEQLFAELGDCPPGHTLERRNNEGHYEAGNCYWAPRIEQVNNRRNNVKITAFGQTRTVACWARERNIPPGTLRARIKQGWDAERALTTPLRHALRDPDGSA
jgi:hypothetical protein